MPRVCVVFDEYSAIHQDRELAQQIERAGVLLATQSRAAGIHLILGAQQAYSDYMHKMIKANITLVLSGRQRTQGAAQTTTGSSSARWLRKIPGRMDCDAGFGNYQVQIPYISPAQMYDGLAKASKWGTGILFCLPGDADFEETQQAPEIVNAPQPFGEELIISIALEQFEGALKARRIYEAINRPDVSRPMVERTIARIMEASEVNHQGQRYTIKRAPGNYGVMVADTKLPSYQADEVPA